MKYSLLTALALVLAVPAYAADMPAKAAALNSYAAAAPSFGGFYVGVHGGGAWGTVDPFGIDANGFVYGGHAGYQVHKGPVVVGLELGITNYANVKPSGFPTGCDCFVGDILAKVGFTVAPTILVYATGGGFLHNANTFGVVPTVGWSAGGGIDWMPMGDHFVVGLRGLYRDLGGTNTSLIEVTGWEVTGRAALKF